jgi:molybdopterin synthase sulfur carrier subunit
VRIVYLAKVRESIGFESEERALPADLTIGALLDQLAAEASHYAEAFATRSKLRFALDQQMVGSAALLGHAQELAIFPPVTGG